MYIFSCVSLLSSRHGDWHTSYLVCVVEVERVEDVVTMTTFTNEPLLRTQLEEREAEAEGGWQSGREREGGREGGREGEWERKRKMEEIAKDIHV